MKFILIKNFVPIGGGFCDYKGLPIESVIKGSQVSLPNDITVCYMVTSCDYLPTDEDIVEIIEDSYNEVVFQVQKLAPRKTLEDLTQLVSEIQNTLDILLLKQEGII